MELLRGSVDEHKLTVRAIPKRPGRRRKCHCGCGGGSTHIMQANGIAMASGCEFAMWKKKQQHEKRRGWK
ncbi:MAG: hypothetical protein GDA50_04340 [Alphaproteobacteria bacterium GM202ARS2]|nr:hypothetical protein [Alphaproteobacteria bacterium GM202ARS2]